jgi:hypothetical protein
MAAKKSRSLRKAIDAHCRSCVYDHVEPGSWLAQVTLCPCTACELYEVRPTTQKIAASVYRYYGVTPPEIAPETLKKGQFGQISEESDDIDVVGRVTR